MGLKKILGELTDSPVKKAWRYFRETLNDEEAFHSFKVLKKPLEITGSEGGRYFLYPSGQVARIDSEKPYLGNARIRKDMARPDYYTALVMWIRFREAEFKKRWGCGSMTLTYNAGELTFGNNQPVPSILDYEGVDGVGPSQGVLGATLNIGASSMVLSDFLDKGISDGIAGAAYLIPDRIYQELKNGGDNQNGEDSSVDE